MLVNSKSSTIFIIFCILLHSVQSFCIYNKTKERIIKFKQKLYHTTANDFTVYKNPEMPPGGRDCCPYKTTDCSSSGTQDEIVIMDFAVFDKLFYTISLPAGGWVNVKDNFDSGEDITFEVFYADGAPFTYTSTYGES